MTTLVLSLNVDTQDQPYNTSGVNWVDIADGSDYLIFTAGSDVVKDGEAIPSSFQLSQAGMVLTGSDILVPHYILADISDNQLKESTLMTRADNRYVLAFDFDGATTSEPVLEAWDNDDMDSTDSVCLGAGTPSNSWLHGITTTDASPGSSSWIGNRLAGSSDTHFLWLNNQNGALSAADTLYCNLYMVVPSTQNDAGAETPILVCKYTTT